MFSAIAEASTAILRDCIETSIGAVQCREAVARSPSSRVQSVRFQTWLEAQQLSLGAALRAAEMHQKREQEEDELETQSLAPEWDEAAENVLLDRLDKLQHELREASAERLRERQLVDRLRRSVVVSEAVYPESGEPAEDVTREIAGLVSVRDKLVSEFLRGRRTCHTLQRELTDVTAENRRLRVANRLAMGEVQVLKAETEALSETLLQSEGARQAKRQLEMETARNTILRNVMQLLIMASGVDWAKDPELQDLLIELGEPLGLGPGL